MNNDSKKWATSRIFQKIWKTVIQKKNGLKEDTHGKKEKGCGRKIIPKFFFHTSIFFPFFQGTFFLELAFFLNHDFQNFLRCTAHFLELLFLCPFFQNPIFQKTLLSPKHTLNKSLYFLDSCFPPLNAAFPKIFFIHKFIFISTFLLFA